MGDKEKEQSQEGEPVTLPLESYVPGGLVAQFSNIFSLANSGNEVFLSFYQPEIPFPGEQHPVGKIRNIQCVARIVLTPPGLKALADLLNKSLQQTSGAVDKAGSA